MLDLQRHGLGRERGPGREGNANRRSHDTGCWGGRLAAVTAEWLLE